MPSFNNFSDLNKYINSQIGNALENEVERVARNTLKENVITEVYDRYAPSEYQRTGGLLQDRNIESNIEDNTLSIRSVRKENGKDIARIVESGTGYTWRDSRIYNMQPFPRPFHEITAQELETKGLAKDALVKGLKRQGLDVK